MTLAERVGGNPLGVDGDEYVEQGGDVIIRNLVEMLQRQYYVLRTASDLCQVRGKAGSGCEACQEAGVGHRAWA